MWAGHEGGGALPVAKGAADVRVAGHHYPEAPTPPIHRGVHTALNWKLQITSTVKTLRYIVTRILGP